MENRQLIVGLGNPGKKYQYTRHNLGFMVIERLAQELKFNLKSSSLIQGLMAKVVHDNTETYFLMPSTYMNESGIAVAQAMKTLGFHHTKILVVCDDLSLPFGKLRLRSEGSAGGHNGLKSIIGHLELQQFPRVRMGINHPGAPSKVVDYVLDDFTQEEKKQLDSFVDQGTACCLLWMKEGIVKAMEKFN